MIKKIILAVTFGAIFVITFAMGVGFIIAGVGDFSWDIVSQYVSMSDITMINDTPISSLFSFSDHSEFVGSHAEGQIGCPTESGIVTFENIAEEVSIIPSDDEFIHLTVDGKIRLSSTVNTAKNLTGNNIPDIEFDFNESTDEAIIKIRKLRGKDIKLEISVPADFKGNIRLKAAGNISISGVKAETAEMKNIAGKVEISAGAFSNMTISDSAGKVNAIGTIGKFKIDNIMGNVKLSSDAPLGGDCKISKIMGTVDVSLPEGSKFKLAKNDIVGIVTPLKGDEKADYTITVDNIVGKVSIDR